MKETRTIPFLKLMRNLSKTVGGIVTDITYKL